MKGRGLALRRRRAAEHLARRRLVEPAFHAGAPDRFQQPQCSQRHYIPGVFGDFEAHLDVALCAEVVYLVRPYLAQHGSQGGCVRKIGVVQEKAWPLFVLVAKDMVDSIGVETRGAALQPMHLITLREQKLRQVGAVLARASRYERSFHGNLL